MKDKITIERTTPTGYEVKEFTIAEALDIVNAELGSKRTVFLDGSPFFGEVLNQEDLKKCRKEISITNQLIGG